MPILSGEPPLDLLELSFENFIKLVKSASSSFEELIDVLKTRTGTNLFEKGCEHL